VFDAAKKVVDDCADATPIQPGTAVMKAIATAATTPGKQCLLNNLMCPFKMCFGWSSGAMGCAA
jgi:hypothetical protein